MDSQKDSRHLLATGLVTLVAALACLVLYLAFRNGTADRDIYVAAFAAWFGPLLVALWLVDMASSQWRVAKTAAQAWREYLYFRYWKAAPGGRFSRTSAEELIRSGRLQFCGFNLQDDRYRLQRTWTGPIPHHTAPSSG